MTRIAILSALAALALTGCAKDGMSLSTAAQARVTMAFDQVCPAVQSGALAPFVAKASTRTQQAYAAAQQICANGAPTDIVVAGLDIMAIEPLLEPYLAKVE
jgi:hypothetical protein